MPGGVAAPVDIRPVAPAPRPGVARRGHRLALLLAGALLAAACATGSGDDAGPGADEGADDATTTTAVDPTATTTRPASPTTAAPAAAPATRLVAHARGETEVPEEPEQVVALDSGTTLVMLLELGVPVAAATLPPTGGESILFEPGALDGIESVGFPDPSIEAIAAVGPDLIVGLDTVTVTDEYDELSRIAPTILVEPTPSDWKDQARRLAEAVNATDELDDRMAAYEAEVAALAADLDDPSAIEVSVVRALADRFRIHTRFHFAGQVIDEVGLSRPAAHRTDDPAERQIELSVEQLDLADADVIYVYAAGALGSVGADVDENLASLRASPLWENLDAVGADAVHLVDPLAWQQGGLPAARVILDDLRRTLLDR